MEQLIASYTATQAIAIAIGIALVLYGRKLYWLALGGVGFFLGLWLANQFLELGSTGLELGVGFLIGVLGAVLATLAQRMAVAFGGFLIGGSLVYWTLSWLAIVRHWQPGLWLWVSVIFGAMLGTFLAAFLFDVSLVALTSLIGALLIAKASHLGAPHEQWLFLLLVFIGMIAQSSNMKRRRRSES